MSVKAPLMVSEPESPLRRVGTSALRRSGTNGEDGEDGSLAWGLAGGAPTLSTLGSNYSHF